MRIEPTNDAAGPSWRIYEDLLVFERALGPSGPFRVLVSRLALCAERGCECRDVGLTAIGLEFETDSSESGLTTEKLSSMLDSQPVMNARLDIDLGSVEPDDYQGRFPLSSEWVEYLQSKVDGELLDQLQDRWLRAKGWRQRSLDQIEHLAREPGELVSWDLTHPDDRRDLYLDGDVAFMADDFYCVNPDCTCDEATLHFTKLVERGRDASVGAARVSLRDGAVVEWKATTREDRALVERLWSAFRARHPRISSRLRTRRQKLTELARHHPASASRARTRAAKRGRNEPCTCGSGKKYKRCCGK